MPTGGRVLKRRSFLRMTAATAAAVAAGGLPGLSGCAEEVTGPGGDSRTPLPIPGSLPVGGTSLIAAAGLARIALGEFTGAWLFNGGLPGPTLRAHRGEQAQLRLLNHLPDPTIVHWHGLLSARGSLKRASARCNQFGRELQQATTSR